MESAVAETLLGIALDAAVPLWAEDVRNLSDREMAASARACVGVVAEQGDVILFRSKKKGETAFAFNRLAEGLAIMSFVPGGVTFLGRHWENKR